MADSYPHCPGTDALYVRAVLLSTLTREWKPGYRDRPSGALSAWVAGPFQDSLLPGRAVNRCLPIPLSDVLAEQESRERIANASVSRKSARGL
jgi:hypothetical protein